MTNDQRLTGPVAITGADGHVGRTLQERPTELPNHVVALGRSDELEVDVLLGDSIAVDPMVTRSRSGVDPHKMAALQTPGGSR